MTADAEMLARLVAQAQGVPGAVDMVMMRELLRAWRDAKKAARGAVIGWVVRIGLALLLLGMAVKMGLVGLVRA